MEPTYTNSIKRSLFAGFAFVVILALMGSGIVLWVALTAFVEELKPAIEVSIHKAVEQLGVVHDFGGNLRVGDIETAYGITSREFQKRQSLEQFTEFVKEHQELRSHWTELAGEEPTDDSCVYKITAELENGKRLVLKLRLQKDENGWKVNDIILP